MGDSAPSNTTTTQKSSPWGPEVPYINQGLASAGNLYRSNPNGPGYYPGQTYAGLNDQENSALGAIQNTGMNGTPALNAAQQGVSGVASGAYAQPGLAAYGQSQGTLQSLMNPSNLNPASNPALQSAIGSTLSSVIPAIQGGFNAGGRADSGDAAYAAANGATQAVGNLEFGQYNTNVQNALSAAQQAGQNENNSITQINQAGAVAPGLNTAALTGQQAAFGAGQAQQTDAQNQITADMARYNYGQMQPYNALGMYENEVNGSGAQGGTSTTTQPYQSNTFANVGSGLSGLASIASIASMFSDRRLKEDIQRVGKASNGLAIYAYRYKGSPQTQIGFMADEVEKKHPEAVMMHPSGFKMVDYAQAARA